ncbi:MAG: methyltransferase [Thermoplasmata archaeon]|nr:methyltransferase [Thermoplasmata archaeon]
MKLDTSIDIDVADEVYNPAEDSFLILNAVEVQAGQTLLEMGAGSGFVALHAAKAGAVVTAADINPHAVDCVRRNALRNDLKVEVVRSDLFENVPGLFDVIVFNPPYLPDEERTTSWVEHAWSGGREGSEVAVKFLEEAWKHLAPKGTVYMILSSVGGIMTVLRASKPHYVAGLIEEKKMFFESVFAYRFTLRTPQPDTEPARLIFQ